MCPRYPYIYSRTKSYDSLSAMLNCTMITTIFRHQHRKHVSHQKDSNRLVLPFLEVFARKNYCFFLYLVFVMQLFVICSNGALVKKMFKNKEKNCWCLMQNLGNILYRVNLDCQGGGYLNQALVICYCTLHTAQGMPRLTNHFSYLNITLNT